MILKPLWIDAFNSPANVYVEAGVYEPLVHINNDYFKVLLSGVRPGHYINEV